MVPLPHGATGDDDGDDATASDGGTDPGFDEATLFRVVRAAVTDALYDVLGTVLLVSVGVILALTGLQVALGALNTAGAALGVALVAVGAYVVTATLGLVPAVADVLDR